MKRHADNERMKRNYLAFLKDAKGRDEASIDAVAQSLDAFDAYNKYREARARAGLVDQTNDAAPASVAALIRPLFSGPLLVSGGFTSESAEQALAEGTADFVAFGRAFIANPDLPTRIARGAALNAPDRSTFYGGAERGYTDYPALEEADA